MPVRFKKRSRKGDQAQRLIPASRFMGGISGEVEYGHDCAERWNLIEWVPNT